MVELLVLPVLLRAKFRQIVQFSLDDRLPLRAQTQRVLEVGLRAVELEYGEVGGAAAEQRLAAGRVEFEGLFAVDEDVGGVMEALVARGDVEVALHEEAVDVAAELGRELGGGVLEEGDGAFVVVHGEEEVAQLEEAVADVLVDPHFLGLFLEGHAPRVLALLEVDELRVEEDGVGRGDTGGCECGAELVDVLGFDGDERLFVLRHGLGGAVEAVEDDAGVDLEGEVFVDEEGCAVADAKLGETSSN
mmetsp:Transcript_5205/g.12526  ORF Transcript_5205/g.12526 Transcript_5205/m.12526 type:complete len:247 (+) Transcript_5205:662-1402(+)